MTPASSGRLRFGWRCLTALLILAPAWAPSGQASAGDQPPPPVTLRAQPPNPAPLQPAAGQAVLFDQMDAAGTNLFILSQNSTTDLYDARAADDFPIGNSSASWHITAVQVVGQYGSGSSDTANVNSVNVGFYADSAGRPGEPLYTSTATPISGTALTGNYYLPLSPPVDLAANASYWVVVQAVQSTSWYWYWRERTVQTLAPAVWQNIGHRPGFSCFDWTAINICSPGTGPDLLFRLIGNQSANHVTPILLSLSPGSAFKHSFTLAAHGIGFASGAVVDWTLGPTQHFTATVSGSTNLTAPVPAAAVTGSYGATVSVRVTNPGPCAGSCTSNALTFVLQNSTYLPLMRR